MAISAHIFGAGFAAAAMGLLLGFGSSTISLSGRVAAATGVGIAMLIIGLSESWSDHGRPLECDRETSKRLAHFPVALGPLFNGALLGVGFTTRLGFWLWYSVPAASFLFGDPLLGAAIYGLYGFARGGAVLALLAAIRRAPDPARSALGDWLAGRYGFTRRAMNGVLLCIAIATLIAVGF